jgi:ABC-type multidrug transport system, permease component
MWVRLLAIVRKEFIHIVRDPRTLGVMFVLPIVQLVLLGYASSSDVRNIPLALLDNDRSTESRQLLDSYLASGQFQLEFVVDSEVELTRLIDAGAVKAGLIIPRGYGREIAARQQVSVAFFIDGSDPSVANTALSSARLIGQAHGNALMLETIERRGAINMQAPIDIRTRVWYNPDMLSVYFMIPALIGLILQLQATMLTSGAIVRERERGTIEQLIVTPIRPFELMLGKTLPYMLVAFFMVIEVLVVGSFWFKVPIRGNIVFLLFASLLFLLVVLGLGLMISTVASNQQESMLLTIATILPSVFLSGFIYPISGLPQWLQAVSYVIPLSYFIDIVRSTMLKGVGFDVLASKVLILGLFAAVLLIVASLRFKKRLE